MSGKRLGFATLHISYEMLGCVKMSLQNSLIEVLIHNDITNCVKLNLIVTIAEYIVM